MSPGAVFFTLLVLLGLLPGDDLWTPLVGASAGIYGILIGVAVIAPNLRVALLFPPIELSMRQLAIALMVISAGSILLKFGGNEGGEAGHLGGAILGFILMRFPRLLGGEPGVEVIRPKVSPHRRRNCARAASLKSSTIPPWTPFSTRFPARASKASPRKSGNSSRRLPTPKKSS